MHDNILPPDPQVRNPSRLIFLQIEERSKNSLSLVSAHTLEQQNFRPFSLSRQEGFTNSPSLLGRVLRCDPLRTASSLTHGCISASLLPTAFSRPLLVLTASSNDHAECVSACPSLLTFSSSADTSSPSIAPSK
jgi:hypothetical protein